MVLWGLARALSAMGRMGAPVLAKVVLVLDFGVRKTLTRISSSLEVFYKGFNRILLGEGGTVGAAKLFGNYAKVVWFTF